MSNEKKRKDLTIQEKIEILKKYDNLPKMGQRQAAFKLNISQPHLCKLLKNRDNIEKATRNNENLTIKRKRYGKDSQIEKALKLWFINVNKKGANINGRMMRQKAEQLAQQMGKKDFIATEGWLQRWKKRENIILRTTHERQQSDVSLAENWIQNEWTKIVSEYSSNHIYNASETGLYFRALPEHTHLIQQNNTNCKRIKEHITVVCCVNMSGNKRKLLVIGKTNNCFKNVKFVDYFSNKNAWMTSKIFNEWLKRWDNELKNDIVLLVNNCQAHIVYTTLKHIKLIFLPTNTPPLLQPCDQGIIRTLKTYYRKEIYSRIINRMEYDNTQTTTDHLARNMNILEVLHVLNMSWQRIPSKTIQNCFKYQEFLQGIMEMVQVILEPSDMSFDDFESWMEIDENIIATNPIKEEDYQAMNDYETEQLEDVLEEVEEIPKIPTVAEIRKALEILRIGLYYRAEDFEKQYDYERYINDVLRNKTDQQSTTIEF